MGLGKGIAKMGVLDLVLGVLLAFTGYSGVLVLLGFSLFITAVMIEEWFERRNEL